MAQEGVNAILQALAGSQARKLQQHQLHMQETQQLAENEQRKEALAQQQKEFDVTSKAAAAMHRLETLKQEQALAQGIQTGQTVPGATVTGTRKDAEGNEYQTYQLPIQGEDQKPLSVELPTPITWAKKQAELQRIITAPAHEAKLSEITTRAEGEAAKANLQKAWDDDRAQKNNNAALARTQLLVNGRLAAARIAKSSGMPQVDTTPYLEGLATGTYNTNDMLKMLPKPTALSVINTATQHGIVPLNKDQQNLVGDLKSNVDTIKLMDEFIAEAPRTHNVVTSTGAGIWGTTNTKLTTIEDELNGRASVLARTLAREKGALSNKDVDRVKTAYLPSRFKTLDANIKKRNDYVKNLISVVDAKLQGVPENQKNIIKQKLGLLDIPLISPSGQPIANPNKGTGETPKATARPPLSSFYMQQAAEEEGEE